ncbi:MAG: hypothetical protein R3B13_38955 [Polyangiaceae bacterium]
MDDQYAAARCACVVSMLDESISCWIRPHAVVETCARFAASAGLNPARSLLTGSCRWLESISLIRDLLPVDISNPMIAIISVQIILPAPFPQEPQIFRNGVPQIFRNHHPSCFVCLL